jgi:hypothetical protein
MKEWCVFAQRPERQGASALVGLPLVGLPLAGLPLAGLPLAGLGGRGMESRRPELGARWAPPGKERPCARVVDWS